MATQEWFFERWAGKLLRWLMGYIFLLGLAMVLYFGIISMKIAAFAYGAILMTPYLFIRYRDPDSTTIPFRSYIS